MVMAVVCELALLVSAMALVMQTRLVMLMNQLAHWDGQLQRLHENAVSISIIHALGEKWFIFVTGQGMMFLAWDASAGWQPQIYWPVNGMNHNPQATNDHN
jgi:hypothetical protein